jgi:hypothetical protein
MPREVTPYDSQSPVTSPAPRATADVHDFEAKETKSTDLEADHGNMDDTSREKKSVYAGLGWLDRLLVLWILLAIIIGILLGNFVDSVGPALQRGKFVDVSIPIGK